MGDLVWLSCPRAGKLDARWEGVQCAVASCSVSVSSDSH